MAKKKSPPRRNWGTGYITQKKNGTFQVRWYENGKRRCKGRLPDREKAERVLDTINGNIANLRTGLPADPLTFPPLSVEAEKWLARRKKTHRAADDDRCRWDKHLGPAFGHLRPSQVDAAAIRKFVETKLTEGMNPATVGHCIRLLSTMFSDLVERASETGVGANPVRTLPRSTRRLMRPTHRPEDTPFLESPTDVRRVYQALRDGDPEHDLRAHRQTAVMFAVGYYAMMRTAEVLALRWSCVDIDKRRILVREQVRKSQRVDRPKDDDPRTVQMQEKLVSILKAWKVESGGEGLLFKPDRPGRRAGRETGTPATYVRPHTLHRHLRAALTACAIPLDPKTGKSLTWYECTRHSGASHYVAAGGSMEKLAHELGHSSTEVTRRYAHMKPDHFKEADRRLLDVDLDQAPAEVVPLAR
jgi:integrase